MSTGAAMREHFEQLKQQILDRTGQAAVLLDGNNRIDSAAALRKVAEDLKNGEFSIVMIGAFSAGKSTILNALMGEHVLPSFLRETTANVNLLRHISKSKDGKEVLVHYKDGSEVGIEKANLEDIKRYVCTEGKEEATRVDYVELFFDSPFLENGITLVDSPGLNGIAAGHRERTEHQLEESCAGIFVFDNAHPGARSDFEIIGEMKGKISSELFVLNKIDVINPSEGETVDSVIQTIKDNFQKALPEVQVPEIWPVSSAMALAARSQRGFEYNHRLPTDDEERTMLLEESRFQVFENRLMEYITRGEKTKAQFSGPVEKVQNALTKLQKDLISEKALLSGTVDQEDIEKAIELVDEKIRTLSADLNKNQGVLKGKVRTGIRDIRENFESNLVRMKDTIISELDDVETEDDLNNMIQTLEGRFLGRAQGLLKRADEDLTRMVLDIAQDEYTEYSSELENTVSSDGAALKIELQNHFDDSERIITAGLDQMKTEETALLRKLDELEAKRDEAEAGSVQARAAARTLARQEEEMTALRMRISAVEDTILPNIVKETRTGTDYVPRRGLLGKIAQVFVGKKRISTTEYVDNDSEYRTAKADRDQKLVDLRAQYAQIEEKHRVSPEPQAEVKDVELIQVQRALQKAYEEMDALQKQHAERMQNAIATFLRKERNKIMNQLEDICGEVTDEAGRVLRESEKKHISAVNALVTTGLNEALQQERKRKEELLKKQGEAENNREARLKELDQKLAEVNELLEQVILLGTEISMLQVSEYENT